MSTTPAMADDISPLSCPEVGHHKHTENKTAVFMSGNIPKTWLSPGGTYSYSRGESVHVTGTVSGSVSADFWKVAHAEVSGSLAISNTATMTQTWSWTNNTGSTRWVQLGIRGYSFTYVEYDVVSPCKIVNHKVKAIAKLPTNEPWLNHS